MKNKILKLIGGVLATVGFIFVVGSIGAFEYENITFLRMVVQMVLGGVGCFLGLACIGAGGGVDYEY